MRPSSFIAPVEKNAELSNGRCCGNNNKNQENKRNRTREVRTEGEI